VLGHGLAADKGHDDGRTDRARRADRAEQIGAVVAIVAQRRRARATLRPNVAQRTLLTNAGLVLEPDLDRLAGGRGRQDSGDALSEVF
jgi:hypothetical protein